MHNKRETTGRSKRRGVALAIAYALSRGASLRATAALFGVSPALVHEIKVRFFGKGPIAHERQPERPRPRA